MRLRNLAIISIVTLTCAVVSLKAQQTSVAPAAGPPAVTRSAVAPAQAPLPPYYVIGVADVLQISFWRDKDLSADTLTVRPDGMISLPLLNEIKAAGLTPEQLRVKLLEAAGKFVEDPDVAVVVREIKSRNVFITGNVAKPGTYPLNNDMTVLQLIAVGGGLLEYADAKNVSVIRMEGAVQHSYPFNYKDVVKQKRTTQNITLKPGDTVVVP
jgi:polysaccharide export outer membrane protein